MRANYESIRPLAEDAKLSISSLMLNSSHTVLRPGFPMGISSNRLTVGKPASSNGYPAPRVGSDTDLNQLTCMCSEGSHEQLIIISLVLSALPRLSDRPGTYSVRSDLHILKDNDIIGGKFRLRGLAVVSDAIKTTFYNRANTFNSEEYKEADRIFSEHASNFCINPLPPSYHSGEFQSLYPADRMTRIILDEQDFFLSRYDDDMREELSRYDSSLSSKDS